MGKYPFNIQMFAGETVTVGASMTEPTVYEDYDSDGSPFVAEIYLVSYDGDSAVLSVYAPSGFSMQNPYVYIELSSGGGNIDTDDVPKGDWYDVDITSLSPDTEYIVGVYGDYDGGTFDANITFTTDAEQSGFTVTYDSNGGSAVTAEEDIEDGGLATEPTDPTRLNYTFAGWFEDDDTFANEWDFTTDTVTEDITLYAKWTQSVENKFTQWGRAVHTLIKAPTSEQKDTDHTLELTDAGKVILAGHATNAVKITIPLNSAVAFPTNTEIAIYKYNDGDLTIGTTDGATLRGSSHTTTFEINDSVAIKKVGTDAWIMSGNFEESA
jgi:uncharacterized repeat protein (TIGR02543 family)